MPKAGTPDRRAAPEAGATAPEAASPVDVALASADAMYRAAVECCHQHDRVARILSRAAMEDEIAAVQKLCALCDQTLRAMADGYEKNAAAIRPQRADDNWWRCANGLWLASREYARRNSSCEAANKDIKQHGRDRLGALHTEYELEASALLGLRQAADAYLKCRPTAA